MTVILILAALFLAAAVWLMSVDDAEGVVQGFGALLLIGAALCLMFAGVEAWRRRRARARSRGAA